MCLIYASCVSAIAQSQCSCTRIPGLFCEKKTSSVKLIKRTYFSHPASAEHVFWNRLIFASAENHSQMRDSKLVKESLSSRLFRMNVAWHGHNAGGGPVWSML